MNHLSFRPLFTAANLRRVSFVLCLAGTAAIAGASDQGNNAEGLQFQLSRKVITPEVISVWPGTAPGETKALPPEMDINKPTDGDVGGRPIIKLTNVSTPTLSIYPAVNATGPAPCMVICPGGGHYILAFDHEGTEVAEWFAERGVTAAVLKYRVPFRNGEKKWEAAVQDTQRAVSLMRANAAKYNIAPAKIGVLGFSAGGQTAGLAALISERQYPKVDAIDDVSLRPDFAALIYPAYLVDDTSGSLREEVTVTKDAPPFFLAHSWDDPITPLSSLVLATRLKQLGVPAELHLFQTGGHGYGIRKTGHPINSWPELCKEWMVFQKILPTTP